MSLIDLILLILGGLLGYYVTSHYFVSGQAA